MSYLLYREGEVLEHRHGYEGETELVKVLQVYPEAEGYDEQYLVREVGDAEQVKWVAESTLSSVKWRKDADMIGWVNVVENKLDLIIKHLGIGEEK